MTVYVIPAKLVLDLIGERESIGEWGSGFRLGGRNDIAYLVA